MLPYKISFKGIVNFQIKNFLFLFESSIQYDLHEKSISYVHTAFLKIKCITFCPKKFLLKKIMHKKFLLKIFQAFPKYAKPVITLLKAPLLKIYKSVNSFKNTSIITKIKLQKYFMLIGKVIQNFVLNTGFDYYNFVN